jgi:hypothetical protein
MWLEEVSIRPLSLLGQARPSRSAERRIVGRLQLVEYAGAYFNFTLDVAPSQTGHGGLDIATAL